MKSRLEAIGAVELNWVNQMGIDEAVRSLTKKTQAFYR